MINKIKQNKIKLIIFAILVLIFCFFVIEKNNIAFAQDFFGGETGWGEGMGFDIKKWLVDSALESIGNLLIKLPATGFTILAYISQHVLWFLFDVATDGAKAMFTPDFYKSLGGFTKNPVIINGWKISANIANIFFIIFLLIIGVGAIFRVEKYNYKKLLIKLAIVALLSNFSLVFAGLILDFTHIIMFSTFKDPITQLSNAISDHLWVDWKTCWHYVGEIISSTEIKVTIMYAMIIPLICGFTLLATFALWAIVMFLIFRVIALWILLVLSPFAYVGMILPDTEGLAKKWWTNFFQYALSGPLLLFFVWFTAQMAGQISGGGSSTANQKPLVNDVSNMLAGRERIFMENHNNRAEARTTILEEAASINGAMAFRKVMFLVFLICLLFGSLVAAASLGVIGAGVAVTAAKGVTLGAIGLSSVGAYKVTSKFLGKAGMRLGDAMEKTGKKKGGVAGKSTQALGKLFKVGGGSLSVSSAVLDPIALGRAGYERVKKFQEGTKVEDADAIQKMGGAIKSAAKFPFSLKKTFKSEVQGREGTRKELKSDIENEQSRKDKAEQEISSLSQENQQYQNRLEQLKERKLEVKWNGELTQEKRKEMQQELEKEIQDLQGNIQTNDQKIQTLGDEVSKRKKEINSAKTSLGELDEKKDTPAGFYSAFEPLITQLTEAAHYDRPEDLKVQEALKGLEGIRSPAQLEQKAKSAQNARELEAVLIKAWETGNQKPVLGALGHKDNAEGIIEMLSKKFSSRRSLLLAGHLSKIADQNDDPYHGNLDMVDPTTKQLRLATPQEQRIGVRNTLNGWNSQKIALNLKKEMISDDPSKKNNLLKTAVEFMKSQNFQNNAHLINQKTADSLAKKVEELDPNNDDHKEMINTIESVLKAREEKRNSYSPIAA
ncbi:MAG: hypothetical protein GF335_04300 [Candidatus Moranbacteria bacterium]|nr:hypothetical protein [Candidatus Moranbacteria bacterium]